MGIAEFFGFGRTEKPALFEFDLGTDDFLIIETDENLSADICMRLRDSFAGVLEKPGRTTIVLTCGLRAKVIHRKVMP